MALEQSLKDIHEAFNQFQRTMDMDLRLELFGDGSGNIVQDFQPSGTKDIVIGFNTEEQLVELLQSPELQKGLFVFYDECSSNNFYEDLEWEDFKSIFSAMRKYNETPFNVPKGSDPLEHIAGV